MKTQERKRIVQHFLLMGVFLFMSFIVQGANAPVTTLGTVCNAVPGEQITIPVIVPDLKISSIQEA